MSRNSLKLCILFVFVVLFSCNEPETIVTNIINRDGSVIRKLEMRSKEKKFKISDIQVPVDSTWIFSDSCEISDKGDTTWVRRAEKYFPETDEINNAYMADSGSNRQLVRYAGFNKEFRWFNTLYRYSETIEKRLKNGYPLSDFMNEEELLFFYTPYSDIKEKFVGPDSLKYKTISDSVDSRKEEWIFRCIVSEWIAVFSEMSGEGKPAGLSPDSLKKSEGRIIDIIKSNEDNIDSLWQSGYILREFIGEENALKYKTEADSSLEIVEDILVEPFRDYTLRIMMPGVLTASNGFADINQTLVWPVMSDYYFAEDYVMWAESKVPNIWAWILSGVFIIFVVTGVVIRKKRG